VVLRGIADALDGHAHSWSRHRKVEALAYCAGEVEAAYERWQRALQLEGEEEAGAAGFLARLAASLEQAAGLGPRARAQARSLADELRARRGDEQTRHLEPWLAAQEKALVAALGQDLGEAGVAALRQQVEAALGPYAGRMPARVLDQVRQESLSRRILEAHGLPRLSLFDLA
jgi:hypothetical protein